MFKDQSAPNAKSLRRRHRHVVLVLPTRFPLQPREKENGHHRLPFAARASLRAASCFSTPPCAALSFTELSRAGSPHRHTKIPSTSTNSPIHPLALTLHHLTATLLVLSASSLSAVLFRAASFLSSSLISFARLSYPCICALRPPSQRQPQIHHNGCNPIYPHRGV